MAVITLPSGRIRSIAWRLVQPSQVNVSEWTGRRHVQASGRGWWEADVQVVTLTAAQVGEWRAFLAALRGRVNTFYLPAVETIQNFHPPALSHAANLTGTSLALTGGTASVTYAPAGGFATITQADARGYQLVQLTSALTTNGSGAATAAFQPAIRYKTAAAALLTQEPFAEMALVEDAYSFSVEPGRFYSLGFSCREAF